MIAHGSDAPQTREQTVRVHIVNANVLAKRNDVMKRFVAAYRESYNWLYADPASVETYAEYAHVPVRLAERIRDEFMLKEAMNPDRVSGIEALTKDAIDFKFMQAPLTPSQLAELIRIPAP